MGGGGVWGSRCVGGWGWGRGGWKKGPRLRPWEPRRRWCRRGLATDREGPPSAGTVHRARWGEGGGGGVRGRRWGGTACTTGGGEHRGRPADGGTCTYPPPDRKRQGWMRTIGGGGRGGMGATRTQLAGVPAVAPSVDATTPAVVGAGSARRRQRRVAGGRGKDTPVDWEGRRRGRPRWRRTLRRPSSTPPRPPLSPLPPSPLPPSTPRTPPLLRHPHLRPWRRW